MRRTILTLAVLLLGWMAISIPVQAADNAPLPAGAPLCLPRLELMNSRDCLILGPAHYLSQMADLGITFPPRPLPAKSPDTSFTAVSYHYAQVVQEDAPIFASLEAAVHGEPVLRRIENGFDFVTYIDVAEVDEKRYYMIDQGIWMRGRDLSRLGATSSFQGLVFRETSNVQFGWLRNQVEAKRTPGYLPKEDNGQVFHRYDLVKVYDVEVVDGVDWYLVGPDQWIEGRQVGRVIPNPKPPEGVKNGRWIEVNLAEQTVAVYDQHQLVFATLVATGLEGAWTQPGLFNIYLKKEAETMQGAFTIDRSDYYYLEDVPWTMYFDQARALHGTYWHNRFGWPQSRGCVNLSPGDANWLFQWANEGDWVYVWDPTGQTPTDPNLYSAGGA
jgi:hypothetical protein